MENREKQEDRKDRSDIRDILDQKAEEVFGVPYLYPYQRLAVSNILEAARVDPESEEQDQNISDENDIRRNQIIILPTGSGKSLIFSLSALFLPKLTVIVFPLLALISDQYRRLCEAGIQAVMIRGGQSSSERKEILGRISRGEVKVVVSNPETLQSEPIRQLLAEAGVSLFVIDETHIVSEWGDSFRPAYHTLNETIQSLSPTLVCALTATASTHIYNRIREILFPGKEVYLLDVNPDRTNILYEVHPVLSVERHLVKLALSEERPAIIFCSSRTSAELTAGMLRFAMQSLAPEKQAVPVEEIRFYHAGLTKEEKTSLEEWFFHSEEGILCSTCAYGMGVDKANIRTVIHRELPSSVEAYLQESGRGGRDRKQAKAILLYSPLEIKRRALMKTELDRSRFDSLLAYAQSRNKNQDGDTQCRREQLLAMLNAEPENCDLCDVCRGTAEIVSAEEEFLREFFRRNSGVFTKEEAVYLLKGIRSLKIRENYLDRNAAFGLMREWSIEAIEEAVEVLIYKKVIRIGSKLFRGRRIVYRRKRNQNNLKTFRRHSEFISES